MNRHTGLALTLLLSSVISSPLSHAAEILEAGFSAVDITPYPIQGGGDPGRPGFVSAFGRIHLGGYAPYYPVPRSIHENRWAVGIHDPVWARAVAVKSKNETLVMISTDLPGLVWKYINPARRQIAKKFGIPFGNIIIASTHSHAGPDAAGYWSTFIPGHGSAYDHQLVKWLVEAGEKALLTLQPAELKTLTTTHFACYDRKTQEMKKDPNCNLPKNRADLDLPGGDQYDEYVIQMDKRDPQVRNTMITVQHYVKPGTHQTLGTFINWHNHPDTLDGDNLFISSDFPHYLREFVESKMGGTAVYFSGTVGAQIGPNAPVPLWSKDKKPVYTGEVTPSGQAIRQWVKDDQWAEIRSIGYEIGNEVVEAIRKNSGPYMAQAELSVKTRQIDIAPTNFLHVLATGSVWRSDIMDSEDSLHWYPGRCMGKYGCVRNDVELVQIGDLSLITAPAEIDPVFLYGREASTAQWRKGKKTWKANFKSYPGVISHLKGPHFAVLGQAQNYLSYMILKSDNVGALNIKHPNHYEDMVTVSKYMGDDVGNLWMEMAGSSFRYNKRKILPRHTKTKPEAQHE